LLTTLFFSSGADSESLLTSSGFLGSSLLLLERALLRFEAHNTTAPLFSDLINFVVD
jgi:hypothetical protein